MPPDMLEALMAGGGGQAPPSDDPMAALLGGGEAAPEAAPEAPEGALHGGSTAEGDPEVYYREALDALEMGMKADVDEARINTMLKCATSIQGELANSQKGGDAMLGGKMDPAMMRRAGAADSAY